MPDYLIDHDAARKYASIGIINGWITVPATFAAGERLSDDTLPASERQHD